MTEEETIAAGAKTFPDNLLREMIVENVDRAIALNNSGLFKVAYILMDEWDRRGYGTATTRAFVNELKEAVAQAEAGRPK